MSQSTQDAETTATPAGSPVNPASTTSPEPEQKPGLIRRLLPPVFFLALTSIAVLNPSSSAIALSIVVLLSMVALHEAGHLVAARMCGVDAPEYSVGFGPRLLAFSPKSGKTRYVLRAIPLGGYVRIRGLGAPSKLEGTDDPSRVVQGRSYEEVSRPRRVFIAFAGPLANILTAVLILFVVFSAAGEHTATLRMLPVEGSPAALAGIKDDELLVAIDGHELESWDEISAYVELSSARKRPLDLTVEDASGTSRHVSVSPRLVDGSPRIGIAPVTVRSDVSPLRAMSDASSTTWEITRATAGSFTSVFRAFSSVPRQLASPSTPAPASERVVSPIGAASLAKESARRDGWAGPATMAAAISVFLALFNLLPLPPLDGSHITITSFEGIASRLRRREVKVSTAWTRRIASAVTLMVLFLGVSAILLDILQPVTMP